MSKLARRIRITHQQATEWGPEQFEFIQGLMKEAVEREFGGLFVWLPCLNTDSYELVPAAEVETSVAAVPFAPGHTLAQDAPGDRFRLLADSLTLDALHGCRAVAVDAVKA